MWFFALAFTAFAAEPEKPCTFYGSGVNPEIAWSKPGDDADVSLKIYDLGSCWGKFSDNTEYLGSLADAMSSCVDGTESCVLNQLKMAGFDKAYPKIFGGLDTQLAKWRKDGTLSKNLKQFSKSMSRFSKVASPQKIKLLKGKHAERLLRAKAALESGTQFVDRWDRARDGDPVAAIRMICAPLVLGEFMTEKIPGLGEMFQSMQASCEQIATGTGQIKEAMDARNMGLKTRAVEQVDAQLLSTKCPGFSADDMPQEFPPYKRFPGRIVGAQDKSDVAHIDAETDEVTCLGDHYHFDIAYNAHDRNGLFPITLPNLVLIARSLQSPRGRRVKAHMAANTWVFSYGLSYETFGTPSSYFDARGHAAELDRWRDYEIADWRAAIYLNGKHTADYDPIARELGARNVEVPVKFRVNGSLWSPATLGIDPTYAVVGHQAPAPSASVLKPIEPRLLPPSAVGFRGTASAGTRLTLSISVPEVLTPDGTRKISAQTVTATVVVPAGPPAHPFNPGLFVVAPYVYVDLDSGEVQVKPPDDHMEDTEKDEDLKKEDKDERRDPPPKGNPRSEGTDVTQDDEEQVAKVEPEDVEEVVIVWVDPCAHDFEGSSNVASTMTVNGRSYTMNRDPCAVVTKLQVDCEKVTVPLLKKRALSGDLSGAASRYSVCWEISMTEAERAVQFWVLEASRKQVEEAGAAGELSIDDLKDNTESGAAGADAGRGEDNTTSTNTRAIGSHAVRDFAKVLGQGEANRAINDNRTSAELRQWLLSRGEHTREWVSDQERIQAERVAVAVADGEERKLVKLADQRRIEELSAKEMADAKHWIETSTTDGDDLRPSWAKPEDRAALQAVMDANTQRELEEAALEEERKLVAAEEAARRLEEQQRREEEEERIREEERKAEAAAAAAQAAAAKLWTCGLRDVGTLFEPWNHWTNEEVAAQFNPGVYGSCGMPVDHVYLLDGTFDDVKRQMHDSVPGSDFPKCRGIYQRHAYCCVTDDGKAAAAGLAAMNCGGMAARVSNAVSPHRVVGRFGFHNVPVSAGGSTRMDCTTTSSNQNTSSMDGALGALTGQGSSTSCREVSVPGATTMSHIVMQGCGLNPAAVVPTNLSTSPEQQARAWASTAWDRPECSAAIRQSLYTCRTDHSLAGKSNVPDTPCP
jgi:hypothetical protein